MSGKKQCKAENRIVVNGELVLTFYCTKMKGHKGFHRTDWVEDVHTNVLILDKDNPDKKKRVTPIII